MAVITADWLNWPETQALLAAFAPETIRFVGGCVRDALLGRVVSDVDVATSLVPDDTIIRLKQAGIKAIPTGYAHGTITALVGSKPFEITTLRRDVATDGRHAQVAYTDDWREDAKRRDFTINALYADTHGAVTDYFGGIDDAQAGIVRFIGDAHDRIREDALRILRFFRFSAYYANAIDAEGLRASETLSALLDTLSGERIASEMLKLLKADNAAAIIDTMQQENILRHVIPQYVDVTALARLPELLRKISYPPDSLLALAALLRSGAGELLIQPLSDRWKLSKADAKQLHALCSKICSADDSLKEQKKIIRALGTSLFIQHKLLCMAEGEDETQNMQAIAFAQQWQIPEFPITGDDLIALGMTPGKEMGEMLKKLEEEWESKEYVADKNLLLEKLPFRAQDI